jgi:predicted ester cyclase
VDRRHAEAGSTRSAELPLEELPIVAPAALECGGMPATATTHRDTVVAAVERFNAGGLDGYMQAYAPDVILHGYPEGVQDINSLRGLYGQLISALDGALITLDEVIEQGDILAARFALRGRHVGELLGVAATGREITIRGATFMRFQAGRIAERWQHADDLGLLQQLGVIPA